MSPGILLICLALGVVMETVSRALQLWRYRRPWLRVVSVVVVFGVGFGWLSSVVSQQPVLVRFAAGAVLGCLYEAVNLHWLRLFTFQEPLSLIRSRTGLILLAGIPWGVLPAVAAPLERLVIR